MEVGQEGSDDSEDEGWKLLCGLEAGGFDEAIDDEDFPPIANVASQKHRQAAESIDAVSMPSKFARARASGPGGDVPVIIGHTSNAGKGLFASRNILQGEVIFVEEAAICAQVHAEPLMSSAVPSHSGATHGVAADAGTDDTKPAAIATIASDDTYTAVSTGAARSFSTGMREWQAYAQQARRQRMHGGYFDVPCCGHCMRSLAPIDAMLPRDLVSPTSPDCGSVPGPVLQIPLPELWPAPPGCGCSCSDSGLCLERYCNTWCRDRAWHSQHILLCRSRAKSLSVTDGCDGGSFDGRSSDGGDSFTAWLNEQPPEHWPHMDGVVRIVRRAAACVLLERRRAARANNCLPAHLPTNADDKNAQDVDVGDFSVQVLLQCLCGTATEADALCPHLAAEGGRGFSRLLAAIRASLGLAPNQDSRSCGEDTTWLDETWVRSTMAAVAQNALHIQPEAPFGTWYARAKRRGESLAAQQAVVAALGGLQPGLTPTAKNSLIRGADAVFRSRVGVDALGIFPLHACLNHSCAPNTEARSYTFTTHSIEVVATRTIRRGEQLMLSYVDKTLPTDARRAKLRRGYLFDCGCSLCVGDSSHI